MKKIFLYCFTLIPVFFTTSCFSQTKSILKKRIVQRRKNTNLQKIVYELGAPCAHSALQKIKGARNLFDELHADTAFQALENINHLRCEIKDNISQRECEYKNKMQALEQKFKNIVQELEQKLKNTIDELEQEKQKIFHTLNVNSVDKAIEKIHHLQSSYDNIVQFAQQIEKDK